jgi:hypothetical protein
MQAKSKTKKRSKEHLFQKAVGKKLFCPLFKSGTSFQKRYLFSKAVDKKVLLSSFWGAEFGFGADFGFGKLCFYRGSSFKYILYQEQS